MKHPAGLKFTFSTYNQANMINAPSYFEIQADDTARTRQFYAAAFGWTFELMGGAPIEYWRIEHPGGLGGLLKRPAKTPGPEHGTNAYVCSMEVKDLDAVAQVIATHG